MLSIAYLRHDKGGIWGADGGEDFETVAAESGEPVLHTMLPGESVDIPEPPAYRLKNKLNAYQLWKLHKEKRALRKAYLDCWQATKSVTGTGRPIDAIITPAAPFAAPPHGRNTYVSFQL